MKKITYLTDARVCSNQMIVEVDDYGIITHIEIIDGCPGNTKGLSVLLPGMKVDEAIRLLEGIDCRNRGTSCPDQLSKAMKQLL
jgi:uncharacterized protein (TIGR03905 family)